ncbi:hypothetical protein LTR99_009604 [Exophiala xenobiotica]|uniref:CENP-V/GFA domain-containing protein n=1 Tax=Vermiconidia calcicola TaxID=1690605 RepID=A0AAV9PW94_9PEZI|nr:hypothetical protein H2202_005018 [Exophiala xenobiotica]KAK5530442.1 hypothetical protein LTR25_009020 [Vermiconidia calcicola]KAK5539117.1 hypothetical protein LTR23_006931 [Chaetothyriales sp. CCFEE 6169]KAK5192642.1 hypothetical protein LTR92_007817 [Exophiala xenobiotica]KAK5216229.1 hypothetical protein LTR72_010800 [Exophiala xenobiotica]
MSRLRPLQGACNCGRNHYAVVVPEAATERAQVFFDDSGDSRRSQGTPLTAWLRVPLAWYSSSTEAFFPDETHTSIRRSFTPLHSPHTQRVFCGYCGTHLSYWTEQPPSEADFMNIALGSLLGRDIQALQELDLLPEDVQTENVQTPQQPAVQTPAKQEQTQGLTRMEPSDRAGSLSWFEEMLDGSRLGRTQNVRRGIGVSPDGKTRVEWEISEFLEEGSGEPQTPTGSKRKIGDVADEDLKMQGQ